MPQYRERRGTPVHLHRWAHQGTVKDWTISSMELVGGRFPFTGVLCWGKGTFGHSVYISVIYKAFNKLRCSSLMISTYLFVVTIMVRFLIQAVAASEKTPHLSIPL